MFERFTEKAINVVSESQRLAKELKAVEILPEHLLLALVEEAKGVSLKLLRMYGITSDSLRAEIEGSLSPAQKAMENVPFSYEVKDILKRTLDLASKSGNPNILFEHLFLAVITDKSSSIHDLLEYFNFDFNNAREILTKLVQKKIKRLEHPEETEEDEKTAFETLYEGAALGEVLERAVSKLSTKGYEILGTEQILASILEAEGSTLSDVVKRNGITSTLFNERAGHAYH